MILLLALLALPEPAQEKGESVSFSTVDKGTSSGFTVPLQMFVSSEKDWADTWEKRLGASKRPRPSVDFAKEVVIVAALGMKDSGGYSIEVSKIVRTKDDVQVIVRIGSPPEGAKPGGGPTSPFVLVKIKKPDKPVTFKEEEKK
jgi:hypothetical protein